MFILFSGKKVDPQQSVAIYIYIYNYIYKTLYDNSDSEDMMQRTTVYIVYSLLST